jgi:hypothetical protein
MKDAHIQAHVDYLQVDPAAKHSTASVAGATALGAVAGVLVGATGMLAMKNKFHHIQTNGDFMEA